MTRLALQFGLLAITGSLAALLPCGAQVGGSAAVPQPGGKLLRSAPRVPHKGKQGARLVANDFDADYQDWQVQSQLGTYLAPLFFPTGGAPSGEGGYIGVSVNPGAFIASQDFQGAHGDAYSGTLSFYLKGNVNPEYPLQVTIKAPLGLVDYNIQGTPGLENWTPFTLSLTPAAGWKLRGANRLLTPSEMVCVLQKISALGIGLFNRDTFLDEVHLNAPVEKAKGKALPGSLDFGTVEAGSSSEKTIRITCTSKSAALQAQFDNVPPGFEITPVGDYCGAIAPAAYQDFNVKFSPTAAGTYGGTATITTNGGNHIPYRLKAQASAAPPSPFKIVKDQSGTPLTALDFGTVWLDSGGEYAVIGTQNRGTTPTTVTFGPLKSPFVGAIGDRTKKFPQTVAIPPGTHFFDSWTPYIDFDVSGLHEGDYQDTLQVTSPVGAVLASLPLHVKVVNGLTADAVVDFGSVVVGQTADRSITVSDEQVYANPHALAPAAPFSASAIPVGVQPGTPGHIDVHFHPTSAAPFQATLQLVAPKGSVAATVTLKGSGVNSIPTIARRRRR